MMYNKMLELKVMNLVADLGDSEWISWKAKEWDDVKGNLQVRHLIHQMVLEFNVPRLLLQDVPACRTAGKPEDEVLSVEIIETPGEIRTVRMTIPRNVSEGDYNWIVSHLETIQHNNIILAANMYREFKLRYMDSLPKKKKVSAVVDDDGDEW